MLQKLWHRTLPDRGWLRSPGRQGDPSTAGRRRILIETFSKKASNFMLKIATTTNSVFGTKLI